MNSLPEHIQSIIMAHLLEAISKYVHVPLNKINPNTSFFEYGLDSIHFHQFIADLEDWTNLKLTDNFPMDCNTLNKLSGYILQQIMGQYQPAKTINAIPERNHHLVNKSSHHGLQISEENKLIVMHNDFSTDPSYLELQNRRIQLGISFEEDNIFFEQHEGILANTTIIKGNKISSYASYNYLGMSGNPVISKAAIQAIKKYGTSVSASRLVSGEKPIHRQLEKEIANLIRTEDSIVFNSGHATNVNTISHLFGPNDLICLDEYAHNSLIQGALFSRATRLSFPHNNWQALDNLLCEQTGKYERALIVLEGVYSMDGDIPDLPHFIKIKNHYGTMLMIDEAHSIGVIGKHGGGIREYFDLDANQVDIWMGTLSKAFGSCGGYIASNRTLINYLKYTCPGFVYSVGITPPDTAAALAAIQFMNSHRELITQLNINAEFARQTALQNGFNIGTSYNTPIIPIIVGNSKKCVDISTQLLAKHINIKPVIYPAVPEGLARLRLFITTQHTQKQIEDTFNVLRKIIGKFT
jgi:8-amino-7-oxononanoate synthase